MQQTIYISKLAAVNKLLQGGKKVAKFAVFAKTFGAGVALILNKTATEYPGTGIQVILTDFMIYGVWTHVKDVFTRQAQKPQPAVSVCW